MDEFLNVDDLIYRESDNPFRPEGDLAKEATEYVKEFSTKLNSPSKSLSTSHNLSNENQNNNTNNSKSFLNQSADSAPAIDENRTNDTNNKSPTATSPGKQPSCCSKEAKTTHTTNAAESSKNKPNNNNTNTNEDKKNPDNAKNNNKKVKSKCQCIIS